MAQKSFTENDAVIVTQRMIHAHHERRLTDCLQCMTDDLIWMGPFEFQRSHGINEYIAAAASEYRSSPITLSREEYHPVFLSHNLFMVYGRYYCTMHPDEGGTIISYPRFTILLREDQGELKIFHMHVARSADENPSLNITPPMRYYEYIGNFFSSQQPDTGISHKKALRDLSGNYHFLFDYEVVRVQGERIYSHFYTIDGDFLVRLSLAEAEKMFCGNLYRIHKSHLVNMMYIQSLKGCTLTLSDGAALPISRAKRGEVMQRFVDKAPEKQ